MGNEKKYKCLKVSMLGVQFAPIHNLNMYSVQAHIEGEISVEAELDFHFHAYAHSLHTP